MLYGITLSSGLSHCLRPGSDSFAGAHLNNCRDSLPAGRCHLRGLTTGLLGRSDGDETRRQRHRAAS
jgi:hypothetical protein